MEERQKACPSKEEYGPREACFEKRLRSKPPLLIPDARAIRDVTSCVIKAIVS
jgi:hypothetical protein